MASKAPYFLAIGAGVAGFYLASGLAGTAANAGRAAGATLALWGAYKLATSFSDSGGLVSAIGEQIIGTPDRAELEVPTPDDTFPVDDPPSMGPFLGGRFLDPLPGGVIRRTAPFGSEYPVRIELRNRSIFPRRVDVSVETVEDDLKPAPPVQMALGTYDLPGRRGLALSGVLKLTTRMILSGRINVRAKLLANGMELNRVDFEVA